MAEETAPLNLPACGPLERFLKAVSDAISEGFEQMGGLTPLVFAVTEKGNGYVIGVPSRLGAATPTKRTSALRSGCVIISASTM
jgi:hypothetical protein